MPLLKSEILLELEELITEGHRLDASFELDEWQYWSRQPEAAFHTFATRSKAAIVRIASKSSEFYLSLPSKLPAQVTTKSAGGSFVAQFTGALEALRRAVAADLLASLESRLRANVYDDFLVQASHLLDAGYHVAAMALVGGVLEDHLMKLCTDRQLTWTGHGAISKYNDLLREKLYAQAVWRRIQSIGDIRNDADHGKGSAVKRDDVDDALKYVHRFLADYP